MRVAPAVINYANLVRRKIRSRRSMPAKYISAYSAAARWNSSDGSGDAIFLILFLSVAVVCGVGADVAYHRHVMGLYVT